MMRDCGAAFRAAMRQAESPHHTYLASRDGRPHMTETFQRHQTGQYTVIEFVTPSLMDPAVLESTAQALYKVIDEEGKRKIVMDFEKVQYMSSQAIGVVLGMHKKLNSLEGSKLVLCAVGPKLMDQLKLTRLDRLLTIKPSRKEAVAG